MKSVRERECGHLRVTLLTPRGARWAHCEPRDSRGQRRRASTASMTHPRSAAKRESEAIAAEKRRRRAREHAFFTEQRELAAVCNSFGSLFKSLDRSCLTAGGGPRGGAAGGMLSLGLLCFGAPRFSCAPARAYSVRVRRASLVAHGAEGLPLAAGSRLQRHQALLALFCCFPI